MKLYHGTKYKFLDIILKYGLAPRTDKKSNFEDLPSHPEMVYLSTAYPWYYAVLTEEGLGKGVVFEIDLDILDPSKLYPDEDFIVQTLNEQNKEQEIEHSDIRENLLLYQAYWQ